MMIKKIDIPYSVRFKCAFCGAENETVHRVRVGTAYNDGLTKRGREKGEEHAEEYLRNKAGKEMDAIDENIKAQRYLPLRLTCKCSQCGRRPAWAYSNNIGPTISRGIGYIRSQYMVEGAIPYLLISLILSIPIAIYKLFQIIYAQIKDMGVNKLDQAYLPVIEAVADDGDNEKKEA